MECHRRRNLGDTEQAAGVGLGRKRNAKAKSRDMKRMTHVGYGIAEAIVVNMNMTVVSYNTPCGPLGCRAIVVAGIERARHEFDDISLS